MASLSNDPSIRQSVIMSEAAYEIYEPVTLLQEMAAYVIAIELLRVRLHIASPVDMLYNGKHEAVVNELPVPGAIKETIKKCFRRVALRMYVWYYEPRYEEKCNRMKPIETPPEADLLCCVWQSNGLIDERKTALNLFSNASSSVDKLRIASEFCMEDEIKKLPLNIPIPSKYTQDEFPLMYWWQGYMKGSCRSRYSATDMLRESWIKTWPAIEYFWDQLSVVKQTELVPEFIKECKYHTLKLLLKMNDAQKRVAFETSCCRIIENLWEFEGYQQIALQIFTSFGTFMSAEQFGEMFTNMLFYSMYLYNEIGDMEFLVNLVEVWHLSLDHLKEHFRQLYTFEVLECYFVFCTEVKMFVYDHERSFDFLWILLSSGSPEYRKKLVLNSFYRYAKKIVCSRFSVLDHLFRLCFPKAKDMAEFKEKFASNGYKASKMNLWINGDRDNFVKFIARYFAAPEDMAMLRKSFLVLEASVVELFDAAAEAVKNGEVEPFEV